MLMDAGRAYPPTGAGRAPKVRSVPITHGRGVTVDHQAGAELRRRSAATVRLALKTASALSDVAALIASRRVPERGEHRALLVDSRVSPVARLYARITVAQHWWVRTPDSANAVAEAPAILRARPSWMVRLIPRMARHCSRPIPT